MKDAGELCGAVFLDNAFKDLLQRKISRKIWNRLGPQGIRFIMHHLWENGIKPEFCDESANLEFHLPFGGCKEDRFQSPTMTFTPEEIKRVYKPVVAEVVNLVCRQVSQAKRASKRLPEYVILVGGFGASRFLGNALREALEEQAPHTTILQGQGSNPWTAIASGAVLRGLSKNDPNPAVHVDARVSRASYGTVCNILPWDADGHDAQDKFWCPIHREFIAIDQTRWFIHNGDTLYEEEPVLHTFWQDVDKSTDVIETELVYSTARTPPSRCDSSVKHLCKVRWSKLPKFHRLPVWKNKKGQFFRQISYEIQMVTDGTSLDFQVLYEGAIVACQNVNVDYSRTGTSVEHEQGARCVKSGRFGI
ncbi:hypothetical protein RJ55_01451 [Drechmeria coniospora]|nr:hypothetical protein RJ55_01451 [Drechmeria coniospora]